MVDIYNPSITDDIAAKALQPVEHHWFKPESAPVILAVGRLAHQKNLDLLIESFSIVRKTRDANLLILGDGDKREELAALIEKLNLQNHVDMPGFVDNPYAYMAKSKIFVLSSLYEALPTVLIEAMHCGTQLVSTDCPNGPNEILDHGKYGQLVPVGDKQAMAGALTAALDNLQFEQDPNACDRFLAENVAKQYIDVFFPNDAHT